ncbi:MAG: rhomboid family intramembrane serine protease, partial [Myxococcales bacterium]
LISFPRSRVLTLIPIIIFPWFVEIPAVIYLAFWFILQLLEGVGQLGAPAQVGGVAVWAHIGGFIAGVVLVKIMEPARRGPPAPVRDLY